MLPKHFQVTRDGLLAVEGHPLQAIAERFGTPLYVVSAAALRHAAQVQHMVVPSARPPVVCYAYKANNLPQVCSILHSIGIGAEVSSEMEFDLAVSLKVPLSETIFNGPFKPRRALDRAVRAGIRYINADSFDELCRINEVAREAGVTASVGLRVAPTIAEALYGWPSRFGVAASSGALQCMRDARSLESIRITGLQFHLGTNIGSVVPYEHAIAEVTELMSQATDRGLMDPDYLDVGGGFGVTPSTLRPDVEAYARSTTHESLLERVTECAARTLSKFGVQTRIVVEPGRRLVGNAALLLSRVVGIKSRNGQPSFVVDAGQTMVSSGLAHRIFHDVIPVRRGRSTKEVKTNLFGCLCYEADVIALGLPLPPLSMGDVLAIMDCGAYDMGLARSFIVPSPGVVLVDGGEIGCVRPPRGI